MTAAAGTDVEPATHQDCGQTLIDRLQSRIEGLVRLVWSIRQHDYASADTLTRVRTNTAKKILLLTEHINAANNGNPDNLDAWKAKAGVILGQVLAGSGAQLEADLRATRFLLSAVSSATTDEQRQAARRRGMLKAVSILEAAITQLEIEDELAADTGDVEPVLSQGEEIFIVHGRDDGQKETVARFLQDLTGRKPIILHEQADIGSTTLIEKFEAAARRVGYAVVVATADDVGRAETDNDLQPRSRQNVVFEMGYFFGLLGRRKVAFLYEPGVEAPSDMSGIVYIALDSNRGWRMALANSIEAAGFEVDRNALR